MGCLLALGTLPAQSATLTVVNTNDTGPGSLRQAMLDANATDEPDTITFNIPGSDEVFAIRPRTPLPAIIRPVTLDGYSQLGASPNTKVVGSDAVLKIELDGSLTSAGAEGLSLSTSNCVVRGLVVTGFGGFGIVIWGNGTEQTGGHVIAGNFVGCDHTGVRAKPNRNNGIITYNSRNDRIGGSAPPDRNLVSGNLGRGIELNASLGGIVSGNYIGTSASGSTPIGNRDEGLLMWRSAVSRIGGVANGEGNLLSGNGAHGISLIGVEASGISIEGNVVGTDASGTMPLGNQGFGIYIEGGKSNTVGSLESNGRNLVSGNRMGGILLGGAEFTHVVGNLVGTDVTGHVAITNFGVGIYLIDAPRNSIGGTSAAAMNVVSGNRSEGIALGGTNCTGNTIQGNFIGTDISGLQRIGNFYSGVNLGGVRSNIIGGTAPGSRNLISGNGGDGISLNGVGCSQNQIHGNFIGTDSSGTKSLRNQFVGVSVNVGTTDNDVGGEGPDEGNLISGNGSTGVDIRSGSTRTKVSGNRIGVDITGTKAIPNGGRGIHVSSMSNLIGGSEPGAGNLISGNLQSGVAIQGNSARLNVVSGNLIGTDITGSLALTNWEAGVLIESASSNRIGGFLASERNVVSGNGWDGVKIDGGTPGFNEVYGNYIGTDSSGSKAVGNRYQGVVLNGISNTIGSPLSGGGNVISGNEGNGLLISSASASGNRVRANLIGTDVSGTQRIGNRYVGIVIGAACRFNVLGGELPGEGNLISGNGTEGVVLGGGSSSNRIAGNHIGTDLTGARSLGNTKNGIWVGNDGNGSIFTRDNLILANLISGNAGSGVYAWSNSVRIRIVGNRIGTDVSGALPVPNGWNGVDLGSASHFTVGGVGPGEGNVIAFNLDRGVGVWSKTNNVIRGNQIFNNSGLGIDLGYDGTTANDATDADTGPNLRQNFPILTSAAVRSGELAVSGRIRTRAESTYLVDVYGNPPWVSRDSGYEHVGTASVTTDSAGRAEFTVTFPSGIPMGYSVTATATDAAGNTSEFCQPVTVKAPGSGGPRLVVAPVSTDVILGESAVFRALGEGQGAVSYQWFRNGLEIAGATEPRLTVTPVSIEDHGQYTVRVADPQGVVESQAVRLRVLPGWVRWETSDGGNGRYYRLTQGAYEAPMAEQEAIALGGHLVSVESAAEQVFLNRTFVKGALERAPFWIGLGDARIEGRWEWMGGVAGTYRNWAQGEPNGGSFESYVAMNWGWAWGPSDLIGTWRDVPLGGTSLNEERSDGPYFGIIETAEDPSLGPEIQIQPVGGNLPTGSDFSMSVSAAGEGPFTYQWRQNGQVITNATSSELLLTNVAPRDAGLYSVVVRNSSAATLSRVAEVVVWSRWQTNGHYYALTAPRANWVRSEEYAVSRGGHLVTINSAEEQTWLVAQFVKPARLYRAFWMGFTDRREETVWEWVSGEPVSYRHWQPGEPNNAGGNEAFSLLNFGRARDGSIYEEGAWNDEKLVGDTGTIVAPGRGPYHGIIETSARPPLVLEIVQQPESRNALAGQSVVFGVQVVGTGSVSYQWQRQGTNLSGAVAPSLALSGLRGSDTGDYRVLVSSGAVTLPSEIARLSVLDPPVIMVQPVSISTNSGARVALTVTAVGNGLLEYEWSRGGVALKDGDRLTGTTNATLVLDPARPEDSGEYQVRVSNEAGGVGSQIALLSVRVVPPSIASGPADAAAAAGEPVHLEVSATGADLRYRWERNGAELPGATAERLDIPSLAVEWEGGYRVIVANDGGSATSRVAQVRLKRCVPPAPGLVAWWTGEDHGTDLLRGREAIIRGSAEFVPGRVGKGFGFDGRGAYLEVAHDLALFPGTNSMAVGAWIRTTNGISYQPIFSKYEAGGDGGEGESLFSFSVRNGRLEGRVRDTDAGGPDAGSDQRITGTKVVSDGQFHHVAFQREIGTGRLSLWVDGTLDAEEPLHPSMRGAILNDDGAEDPFLIGAEYAFGSTAFSGFFQGEIDELIVAHRSIGGDEIAAIFESGGAGMCPPPIVMIESPRSMRVRLGERVTLSVTARALAPLTYRWRLNGQEIESATNAVLEIAALGLAQAGRYTVVVSDGENFEESAPAQVELEIPDVALVDRFGDRLVFVASSGMGRANNLGATSEVGVGEPRHAGKRGGKSLWMTWRPGQSGVATFRTVGSNFDTLLAVYEGNSLASLVEVASDEDSGGFLTSVVRFNAESGRDYQIAVDGFAGATGTVVLSWDLDVAVPALPRIAQQPGDRLGRLGDPVVLQVVAGPPGVAFQWFRNGVLLAGRTASTLLFEAIRAADAGTYRVRVRAPNGATLDSEEAVVDVVDRRLEEPELSADKLDDLFPDAERGGAVGPSLHAAGAGGAVTTFSVGLGGSQWTDTRRSSRSADDPKICGAATTGSRWFRLRFALPAGNKLPLELNTEDSEIPAMLAVFTNRLALTLVGCDTAAPPSKLAARVAWVPQPNVDYLVLVDGVRGSRGRIQLNREVVALSESETPRPKPTEIGFDAGRMVIRMFPLPGLYDWQVGAGLESMQTLFRTNLTVDKFEFMDPEPATAASRIYQLKLVSP